jgi:hypothetical protein
MFSQKNQKSNNGATDVIVILDESGSMSYMGDEPVRSINSFIEEQKKHFNENDTFTLITFSDRSKVVIDEEPLSSISPLNTKYYNPSGGTALNDALCITIKKRCESDKPYNKVVVIVTDGCENSSKLYKKYDVKHMIENTEINYNWKFVFLGSNINAFEEGSSISIKNARCAQFNSSCPGDLLFLSRQTSIDVSKYRRSRSEGYVNTDLVLTESFIKSGTFPVGNVPINMYTNNLQPLPICTLKRTGSTCV